mgnify:CR=1 FL=1
MYQNEYEAELAKNIRLTKELEAIKLRKKNEVLEAEIRKNMQKSLDEDSTIGRMFKDD